MNYVNTAFLCDENELEEILEFDKTERTHKYGMKILNFIKSFSRHLSYDKHNQYQQIKSYNKLLNKLQEKKIFLQNKLQDENNENHRKTLEMRLAVNCVQRKKAITAINKLINSI